MDAPVMFFIVAIAILAIMGIMVIGVDHTIPMYVRANFDDICNKYLAVIERDGKLSSSERDHLRTELNNLEITSVTINAPVNGNWGDEVTLRVEGEYNFQTTQFSDFSKKSITKKITYENSTMNLSND